EQLASAPPAACSSVVLIADPPAIVTGGFSLMNPSASAMNWSAAWAGGGPPTGPTTAPVTMPATTAIAAVSRAAAERLGTGSRPVVMVPPVKYGLGAALRRRGMTSGCAGYRPDGAGCVDGSWPPSARGCR